MTVRPYGRTQATANNAIGRRGLLHSTVVPSLQLASFGHGELDKGRGTWALDMYVDMDMVQDFGRWSEVWSEFVPIVWVLTFSRLRSLVASVVVSSKSIG